MQRIFFASSDCEMKIIAEEARAQGFSDPKRFLHRKLAASVGLVTYLLQETEQTLCEKRTHAIPVVDEKVVALLNTYCEKNNIKMGTLVRRLAIDPILLRRFEAAAIVS